MWGSNAGHGKALSGHLGQPSMCSGCPCYLVSNRWSLVHYSLPGCWVSGWKLQKHPAGRVRGCKSHWSVTGWLVQTLPYENDFPSSDGVPLAPAPHTRRSKCRTLSSKSKTQSFPEAASSLTPGILARFFVIGTCVKSP